MDISKINELINNIVFIQDKKTKKNIEYKVITVENITAKYSNTKKPIYKIKIDDKLINRNNSLLVKYKCITCKKEHIVALNNISRKINKNQIECRICKELNIGKIQNQSQMMLTNQYTNNIGFNKKNLEELSYDNFIKLSEQEFNDEEDEFQHMYFRKHLTVDDFDRIRNKIISIQNGKITDLSQLQYISNLIVYNQTKYNPHLYDSKNEEFIKIYYIKFQCDSCENTFMNRDLCIQKNKLKILCKDCNFVNNIFKIRLTKNCNGKKITYQSKLELKFIAYCNKNNIVVENGPKINYNHNNKSKRHIVDFYLPQLNILIELKNNNHWHKENKKNGKWTDKINAVKELVDNNIYSEFILIYSNELIKKCNLILKKIKEL